MPKKSKLKTPRQPKFGSLVCFLGSERRLYKFDEVLRFPVCFGQVEQMNKKVSTTCLEKLPTVMAGTFSKMRRPKTRRGGK